MHPLTRQSRLLNLLATAALAVAAWTAAQGPVQAGKDRAPDRILKLEVTDTGTQLKMRGRGWVETKSQSSRAQVRLEVESRMLGAGACLSVYAAPAGGSETRALVGTIELAQDPRVPELVRGTLEWTPSESGALPELRVTNACDATLVYLVAR